jgi:RND family efflux transporter MFP subunit
VNPSPPRRKTAIVLLIAAILAAILVLAHRGKGAQSPPIVPTVAVTPVVRRDLYRELTIEAEFRPYQEIELYSEVAGYLKSINVDFGDRVKAGELIATIEVPQLRDELDQAIAAEQRAEADHRDAHLAYTRLAGVNRTQPNLIAQQDLDTGEARDSALAAAVAGAKADVEKFQTLIGYTRITAPFDGVVTARSADPGAMIQAATSSQSQALPLIQLSENQVLRLDFPVSVSYAGEMAVGDPVEIRLEGSDRVLHANISRFTRKVAMATRTMITEVEVPNPDLKLIPGMYATVALKLDRHTGALAVPIEAVSSAGNPTVYLIGSGGIVEERPVKLGLETDSYCEILDGLREGDLVVTGSRSGIQPGTRVAARIVGDSPPS